MKHGDRNPDFPVQYEVHWRPPETRLAWDVTLCHEDGMGDVIALFYRKRDATRYVAFLNQNIKNRKSE